MMNVRIPLIFIIFSLFSLGASATLQEAERLFEQGRSADALSKVNSLLSSSPNDPEARFLKGLIQADGGDSGSAIETFAALTQDHPELPEPWNNLAVLFADRGEFDKARESLLAAIQTHPSYTTAHENLGDLYARMAGMAYDRALEQDRGRESARLKLSAVKGLFAVPGAANVMVASNNTPPSVTITDPAPVAVEPATTVTEPEPVATEPPTQVAAVTPKPRDPVVTTPVSLPEPVATTPVVSAPAPSAADVEAAVNRWASAWSAKNVQGYLASYSRNFRPSNGASYRAWADYRRDRLTKPKVIEVDLSNMNVNFSGADNATATFRQKYRSDNYRDEVTKTLTMVKSNGNWLIVGEVSE